VRRLVVATGNPHKVGELRALCAGLPVEIVPIGVIAPDWHIEETGATFEQNATLKARAAASRSGEWALGDDSGLEVDALGGAPGVKSARFAGGTGHDDAANNRKLLALLASVAAERRAARFRCVLALASPAGTLRTAAGVCEGWIALAPRGSGGFGYDPLFEVAEPGGRTMAELSPGEKNRVSHRARALAALRPLVERIL